MTLPQEIRKARYMHRTLAGRAEYVNSIPEPFSGMLFLKRGEKVGVRAALGGSTRGKEN